MENFTIGKTVIIALLVTAGVAGCSSDSVSYDVTDRNHSITLLRDKVFFWSQDYEQAAVISNMPDCQRRYRLDNAAFEPYAVEIYDYDLDHHLWIVQGQYYLLDHINCSFQKINPIEPAKDQYIGRFTDNKDGKLIFENHLTNTISPGTALRGR